jgi:hypothetical protein
LKDELVAALRSIKADPNELAYFALTSKPEAQIRDRLAYRLHEMLADQDDLLVAREWKRMDLAVLKPGRTLVPVALVEAKALLSADLLYSKRVSAWRARVHADIEKARQCAKGAKAPDAEIYALVIATHVLTEVQSEQREFVKYGVRLAKVTPWEEARQRMIAFLPEVPAPCEQSFGRGQAFGIEVELSSWLFGPV